MKLCELKTFTGYGVGWVLSILKFKNRVFFEFEVEKYEYSNYTLLLQIGEFSLLFLTLSLGNYSVSLSLLGKNYGK